MAYGSKLLFRARTGPLLTLPFDYWRGGACQNLNLLTRILRNGDNLSVEEMRAIGCTVLPERMRQRLLGPSEADVGLEPLAIFHQASPIHKPNNGYLDYLGNHRTPIKAIKAMVAYTLRIYLHKILCGRRRDAASAFLLPRAATGLHEDYQLAVGLMRELNILPRFGSMRAFWLAHEEMRQEGGNLLNFDFQQSISDERARELFANEPVEPVKLLEIFYEIGFPRESLDIGMILVEGWRI